MKHFLHILAFLAVMLAPGMTGAQTTGSFDTTISFMSGTRKLSLYVPVNYSPANKYRLMIALHGLGDSCVTYRNALINSLGWGVAMPNTIFVCPEAENKNVDFYTFSGSETIIQQSIAVAMARYHIDTANVVLQGFSLGGRAALRYGLDHHSVFKGLLLNTPAVQGIKQALNGHAPFYAFSYANAPLIPIAITHGANDLAYTSSIDSTYEQLVRHNGIVRHIDYPGLGHGMPAVSHILSLLSFFDAPARAGKDADAVLFYPRPFLSCQTPALAQLLFRNTGEDTLHTIKFRYTLGSQTQSGVWTGTLAPFAHATFTASFPNPAAGENVVTIVIDSLDGAADTVTGNNQQAAGIHQSGPALSSLNEGFEGAAFPPPGWVVEAAGDFYTAWDGDDVVSKTGDKSAYTFNTILFFDNSGRQEGLVTPVVTLPALNPEFSFDVAFNYHRYTPPYFTAVTDFTDTLEVLVSTDCGEHYSRLYKKGGAELATFASPILNPLTVQADFINPKDSNWRREHISLSSIPGGPNQAARFKFSYKSGLGGSIHIDNVRLGTATGIPSGQSSPTYAVYPNPADRTLTIGRAMGTKATMTNAMGQVVLAQHITTDTERMEVADLPAGLYLLTITDSKGAKVTMKVTKR